jgi:hypothetical protein
MASLLTVVHWRRVALAGTWIHMRNVQQSGSFCSRNACLRVAGPPYQLENCRALFGESSRRHVAI